MNQTEFPEDAIRELRAAGRCLQTCAVRGRSRVSGASGVDVFISHNGTEFNATFSHYAGIVGVWGNVVEWFGQKARAEHPASIVADLPVPKRIPTHEDVMAAIAWVEMAHRPDVHGLGCPGSEQKTVSVFYARRIYFAWIESLELGELYNV